MWLRVCSAFKELIMKWFRAEWARLSWRVQPDDEGCCGRLRKALTALFSQDENRFGLWSCWFQIELVLYTVYNEIVARFYFMNIFIFRPFFLTLEWTFLCYSPHCFFSSTTLTFLFNITLFHCVDALCWTASLTISTSGCQTHIILKTIVLWRHSNQREALNASNQLHFASRCFEVCQARVTLSNQYHICRKSAVWKFNCLLTAGD